MNYEKYAHLIGFNNINGIYVREENGFKVYLKDWQYLIYGFPAFYIPLNKQITKEELKRIEKASLDNVGAMYSLGDKNNTLIMSLQDGKKDDEKVVSIINEEIVRVCKLLKADGYLKMEECPVCKKNGEYGTFGDDYCPIHNECNNKHIEHIKELSKKESEFNYKCILLVLLVLAVALISTIPFILLVTLMSKIKAALLALVTISSLATYYFVKVPNQKWMRYSISLIIFLVIISTGSYGFYYIINENSTNFIELIKEDMGLLVDLFFIILLSMGGIGGIKFLNKFKKNYTLELKKFDR